MSDLIKGREILSILCAIRAPATLDEIIDIISAKHPDISVTEIKTKVKRALKQAVNLGFLENQDTYYFTKIGAESIFLSESMSNQLNVLNGQTRPCHAVGDALVNNSQSTEFLMTALADLIRDAVESSSEKDLPKKSSMKHVKARDHDDNENDIDDIYDIFDTGHIDDNEDIDDHEVSCDDEKLGGESVINENEDKYADDNVDDEDFLGDYEFENEQDDKDEQDSEVEYEEDDESVQADNNAESGIEENNVADLKKELKGDTNSAHNDSDLNVCSDSECNYETSAGSMTSGPKKRNSRKRYRSPSVFEAFVAEINAVCVPNVCECSLGLGILDIVNSTTGKFLTYSPSCSICRLRAQKTMSCKRKRMCKRSERRSQQYAGKYKHAKCGSKRKRSESCKCKLWSEKKKCRYQ